MREDRDGARAARLAEINGEIGRRRAALGRGETVRPAGERVRLQAKPGQRQKTRA